LRDVPGLSLDQRAFLARRLRVETDAEAARLTGVHPNTVATKWKADPAFAAEYERVVTAQADDLFARLREELARVGQQAPAAVADLLTAETPIVDRTGAVVGQRPDWSARAKGVEALQRAAGLWNPQERGNGGGADGVVRMLEALGEIQKRATAPPATRDIIEGTARPASAGAAPDPLPEPRQQ